MRTTMLMAWIVALTSYARAAQEPERMRTPAEMIAAMEADLHGRADAIYGSDLTAQWNAMMRANPANRIMDSLRLPNPPRQPIITETVSAAALRHAVPKAAVKAHERARKLFEAGKSGDAQRELEKALALDPEYAEAHENLGALYLKLNRPAEAETHIRRAIELNPSSSVAHSDLAAIQLLSGDLGAAERSARRALELSRGNDWARFVLGMTLLRNTATYGEALRQLESASRSVPAAGQILAALPVK